MTRDAVVAVLHEEAARGALVVLATHDSAVSAGCSRALVLSGAAVGG